MELYLSACSKAADVAATKTATSGLTTESQQCGDLFRPSYGFNLTDPYCRLLENQYKSLHDPHLRAYHKRKDILRRLKKGGYITSNNKVVCTLRELNKYRQYLTSLKLDFERNYIREQSHELDKNEKAAHIYLDMIRKELEHLEHTAEEQRLLRMDREERRQREHARRKLSLRRKIEEEWKTKEMLLLTRIGEDVKREARIEEQRRKSREETDKKKNGETSEKPSVFDDRGEPFVSTQNSMISPQNSATRKFPRSSLMYLNHSKVEVTSEELNSIIQNIMTWVVATVTSILYPAITKYEERLKNNTYPVSDDSVLSSDSSSFCSTCSEEFTYGSYTSATIKSFKREPCAFAVDISVRRPTTPLKPSAHVEKAVVGETCHMTGQSVTNEPKHNETSMAYTYPDLRSCKSDSHPLASPETGTKKSKDATTETDGLENPSLSDQKAKAMNEMKSLKNVFVNFKCHLKGETELILESIFQEIMSDLTHAIPSISSVTAEVFIDQSEPVRGDLVSSADICSVASEIVENMLEKLQSAVEKKCVQIYSQEDLSVKIQPSLTPSGESLTLSYRKPLIASVPSTAESMCDVAEDMVHAILEKLMTLTAHKQSELPHLQEATKLSYQQHMTDPTCMRQINANKKKCNPELDAANLIVKEKIQNLMSNILSQSSLVGYIEEAISTILGYVQTELNNERLIASEETVVLLKLLDDIFTQLHQEPVKAGNQKCRHSRLVSPSDTEVKYRLTGTRLPNGRRSGRPFPPINVPGMVLYSEDDNEEVDRIVENVLDSSFKDEKAKSQEQIPEHWFTKGNACLEYQRNSKLPAKPVSPRSKATFHSRRLRTELPYLKDRKILKEKPCLHKDILFFSQDQKHQIQKVSENTVKSILTEMLKDISSVPPGHLESRTDKASVLVSEKPQEPSHQEWMDQLFSVSEISTVAQEITDTILNILQKASCIPNTTKSSISSSVHPASQESPDTLHMAKAAPNKKPLKIWFDSEKKMKYLSSLDGDLAKPTPLKSEESEPKPADEITDKIINAVFKKLKLFICPKLQMGFKPSLAEKSSLQSQLSTYTAKVVNIVLLAIQNELELSEKNLNLREENYIKSHTGKGCFTDTKKLESLVSNLNDDIMESPLLTCICEILSSGHSDQSNISLSSDNSKPTTLSDNVDKGNILPSRQDKASFYKILATPCALHSVTNGKDLKENSRLQVLDNIGETLYEMLCKLIWAHPHCQPSCSKLSREKTNKNQQRATELQSNIQLISTTILEYIIAKLCSVNTDTSSVSSGCKAISESLDIDNLSFTSIIEEMAKCTDIISSIVSRIVEEGDKEMTKSMEKPFAPKSSKTGSAKEMHSNKLKAVASDILNMVFAKLEGFANGNLETLDSTNDENKKSSKMNMECESFSVFTDTHEELLQSALYTNAKKVSSAILKAIQTELNMNSLDLRTSVKTPPPEKKMLENIVSLILDAVSSDMLNETESEERDGETYGYRPIYGNFLPGGAESDSFPEDATNTEKEFIGERIPLREETQSDSLQQWVLERTLNKLEVKLKEPQKSPIVPIIRNILNEIFQNALVSQLNMLFLSHSLLSDIPHNVDEPIAQTPVPFIDKMMVSEADVTMVADDVVTTVFDKLYTATKTETIASENSYKTITFSANVSFHEHTYGRGKPSITALNKNPYTLQSRFNIDRQAKGNIVEDIVQAILTSLETFVTSKVQSLFCPQINFTVPMASPVQQGESTLSKALSAKDLYSEGQFSSCSVDNVMSQNTNSFCQVSLNKLNIYATEVARKILKGIKNELDKEKETHFLTNNIVVSESITSQIVNTVFDIVSSKGKCDKNSSDKETSSDQQEGIIEKLFKKIQYRKVLQFQIQDTIESVLCDIYEKTLNQNDLSFATPTLKRSIAGKHSRANSDTEGVNKILPKFSVPKSDVILISNDIVDVVLHNLSSVVMLTINAKDPASTRLPLTFRDTFPKAQCQQSLLMESESERETEHFPSSKILKPAYANDRQITIVEKEDPKKSVPDPCEESANFITQSIFNWLESFATERIDSFIMLAFQPKEKSFVRPELENCKQDGIIFHEPSQVESNVNILKISNETILSQELTDSTFASYREKLGSTIHLSQASLKEYSDIIASAILNFIKNDLDLEIQKMHPYPNSVSFQEITIVSEIVNGILKSLHNKRSAKEISFSSKDNPNLFSQLTISNEISLGQRAQEKNTKLSLFSKYPLEQNQMALERESQRIVLEEIFMRNEKSKQKERTALFSAVEEVLSKVYQKIIEIIGHLPSFNEKPHSKTSDIIQKNFCQSHINSAASDIIENVLGKMYSVIVTSLYENNEGEPADKNILPKKSPCVRETKAGIGSSVTRFVLPQVYPYADSRNSSLLENTFLRYSPSQVGKDLIHMVLKKITNFASFYLEETVSHESCSDELQPLRLHSSKVSPKPSVKTSLKAKSKVTPLPKFRTKPHIGLSRAKAKSRTKLSPGEKTLKDVWSETDIGLPHILSTGDAKSLLEMKLPTSELKMYAKDIISNILKTIVKELEKETRARAMVSNRALLSDQIVSANQIVNTVLQGLYAINNHSSANPIKFLHLDDPKLSQGNIGAEFLAKPQACFYLENVSSQLEQIFPKEGIFKKMFDKWQAESNDMENEKCKLLMIAENDLTEISIKAKELEYSLSLLNLPHLEDCENRFHSCFKGASTRAEDTKAQINIFGREIVEMLFEKLQLCFLSQMTTPYGKETPAIRKEHITTKSKYGFPTKDILSNVPVCNTKTKDQSTLGSSNQIVREIVERVLNMLESFVDLQFKHISKYEFSEIVKMPVENLFPVQQRLLSKKILPKLQPLKKFSDESKSSTIVSKENVQNTLLQVHSFHSELLTYAVNIVHNMLGVIKNKLDQEISQVEPSSVSILKENTAASDIIGTLMYQCAHFSESLIKNLPKENFFQGVENTCIVNQVELATNTKMPMLKLKEVSFGNNLPQSSVPGLDFYSEENMKKRYKSSSNLPSYSRASVEDTVRNSEPMKRPDSENRPSSSRNKVQDTIPKESDLGYFDQAMKGSSSLPEGSVLQKLLKKANESTETALKQVMSFIELRQGENPRVFHYEISKPVVEPNQIQTSVSPLKICLAAENIVSTVLSSYGFPNQPHINESMETMKPFFISKQDPLSKTSGGQKNEEKSLLRTWDKKISSILEEENKAEVRREDFSLLQKWENKSYLKIKTLKKVEVIAFADHELGPNEIHLVSRHVTTSVVTYFKNFETRDEQPDEAMDSEIKARTFFSSSYEEQCNNILGNNLGLSPKSVFLLNVVCEKLIRTLLEKCTKSVFLDNCPLSEEVSAEECQLLKVLQSVDEEFDSCNGAMDFEQFQGDYMSDILENLAETDPDLLSSDSMLTIISHSLVKSLMDKLHHSIQFPQSPPFANKYLKYGTRGIQSSFIKAKRPELTELEKGRGALGYMSYYGHDLTGPLNNPSVVSSKIQAPFGKKYSVNFANVPPLKRQGTKDTNTIAIHNKLYLGDMNTGVYSATFLEDIISELFFNLSISLLGKNENIIGAQLNEMNTLFVNSVVNEFNKARVTVLRNSEERLCFPPIHKETVSRIVDSVYYGVLQQYKSKVICGGNLACDSTSIAEQITNSILLETLHYQLPSCFREKLLHNSYYPLNAEIILQKLQNNLREFTSKPRSLTDYSTMLSQSFLEDIIRRLLSQLIPPPSKASSLENKYFMSSDFNEMSTCIINKVISAISKHKIWFTIYDNQYLCTGKSLQKMVDSVYRNIMQTYDSLISIQKSILSRNPILVDRIASFIIQEIIEYHLQPFLCGEGLPRPKTPSDAISNMVKQVLNEVIESHRPQTPSAPGIYSETFVREIVARLLSKIFSPKHNTEIELENMTQKIVNSVNNHFDKAKVHLLCNDKEQSYPSVDTDIVDELVTSVYRNALKQYGLDPEFDKESEDSSIFVEKITNLVVAAISDYLLHPLFSGNLSSSYPLSTTDNLVQDILSNIGGSTIPSQSLSPYNTFLPYTFLEDMIRVLLSRIFPSAHSIAANREIPKDRSKTNFNEIASDIISDIRRKISQHEIRFSKDEEGTKFLYSEDDIHHLVDSVFKNILNSESQELVEPSITSSSDVLIDKIAGFIIKHVCQQHLQPFVDGKSLPSSSYTYLDDERRQWFHASVYSSEFLEDVISGVLSKIFHRGLGIVQTKSVRDSEDELCDKAEKLIHFITEEFSRAKVSILENAEKILYLPPVKRDVVKNIIDMVYSKVVQEYEMEIMPDKNFLNDTKALATKITEIILAETSDFQIHPNLTEKLPFGSQSKLSSDILIKKVHRDITKSRSQRQASTIYTTMLSHTHLEKIVSQLISQMSPLASSTEHQDTSQSDLSNTVIKLINEIMSIISKHAVCIIKHGNEKHSIISEKDIQSMVDSIYAALSYSSIYQSLTKDKKDISNIPVTKIASFIIKEIFNHHLQSFSSGDKTILSAAVDQTYKQKTLDPKEKELSFIMNSAVFLEEVISELLCKLLYAFSHNVLAAENPDIVKAKVTGIVTTLVKSIVLEFTTSEIFLADSFDADMCFSEGYKEMVKRTVNLTYEKILDEYKSLIQIYRAMQSDTACFGRKIYNFLLEEIYDYQVKSLVSGELISSSYSSPQADKIIGNVLNVITRDSHALPPCITVLPHSLLEDMIYKLLVHIFPSADSESELKEGEVSDYEFMDAASKLTDEIIKEISEHEICLATAEENTESVQLEVIEDLINSICNNILKKSEFQAEVQKDANKNGGSFLSKIAGFIMKEIMDHHLQPFLRGEESSSNSLSNYDHVSVHTIPGKEKTQPSLYSATFLEDVIVDLVRKFCSLPSNTEEIKKKEKSEPDVVSLAIKFANSLIGEFRKSEIKVLPNAEEMLSFPPIDKETVDKISDFVYDQFIGTYESNDIQKNGKNNIVIEMIATLTQKAISAFKIQPLFSGDWSSTFFSFLNPDNITQRVKHLPQQTSTQINRCLKENQLTLPEESYKHTSLTSDQKNVLDTLEVDRGAMSKKKSLETKETSMKIGDIQDPVVTSVTSIMKSNVVNLLSGPAAGVANKENKNKMGIPVQKYNGSKVTCPTTSVKTKEKQEPYLKGTLKNNETDKKRISASDKEGRGKEVHTQFLVATDGERGIFQLDFKIDNEKKVDETKESSLKTGDNSLQLPSLIAKVRNTENTIEKPSEAVTQKPNDEDRKDSSAQINIQEGQYSDYELVENVTKNIYENIFGMYHSQESADYLKQQSLPSHTASPLTQALPVTQEIGKDFAQSVLTKDLPLSANKNLPAKEEEEKEDASKIEKEREKKRGGRREDDSVKVKDIKKEPSKPDSPQYPPKREPGVFPAKFLEDVITETINKLVFSSSPETQTYDRCQNVCDDENQAELYDTAMRLIDSLLKEFSDAQIKVFRPDKEYQFFPPADKVSSVPKEYPRHKESNINEAPCNIKTITVDKSHTMTEKPSSNKILFLDKMSSIDKTLVNKVVHASVCNILKEYKSQDSICKNIKSNGGHLVRRLTSAMINEIFQHKLNLILCDEFPASSCLPLETKDVVKKVQKLAQTANKECQTSSPYTIILPHEFLENVISTLLSKIFSTISNIKTETYEGSWFTELDFLQMKLLSIVTTEISKDENMIIQYVESLHPSDDEAIQLVVQSLYDNLLSQFGSQESIQNCAASGCRILSETIVDLIRREVTGNQLQNYFSGELTPYQCAEVDNVVENILKDVIQTADIPQPHPSQACILPYNIIEEIAVKFLLKLLSVFPKVDKERPKSLETEMQKITSKILNSIQEVISKNKIKVVSPAKEIPTALLANNEAIEKVVNSVYTSILKHSGSLTSIFKDLMGKSNILSDIIGFLMVKEISKSKFQPQIQEELSGPELALEAVKIMEKVVKMVDKFKSQEKSSSKKVSMLDAMFLEEALALFLAKIVRLPSESSKHAKNLSKPELNKIASQLTKSVTAEISKSNINLVATDSEGYFLNPESIEMVSQVIDSIYSNVLQQSGSQKDLYHDIKSTNRVFPKKVANLIVNEVSNFPFDSASPKNSNACFLGDLDINRIVEKAQEHAVNMIPDLDKKSTKDSIVEDFAIKIIPHVGNKPLKIDPNIISEHLAVISIKTQPLEELQTECLKNTGHNIAELRRASISGRSRPSNTFTIRELKRERRTSLNKIGRLDIKPFEAVCRNSFQNIRKPDITKVELLKDVQNKKELILRLVAHDIEQEISESNIEEELTSSDEDEVVLREIVQEHSGENIEDQVKDSTKPVESKVVSPKPTQSTSSLKKFFSLSKCCQPTSNANVEHTGTMSNHVIDAKKGQIKRTIAELDMSPCSGTFTETDSTWEEKSQSKQVLRNKSQKIQAVLRNFQV
ncbi:hypothetical protein MG293_004288 [Ovis ammon polii]|uniref:Fibrous sheath-interacting protein 2 C-terminal domain-containing protein n=1 Tax=Ovis ammon polii TaxID=230172 RepID=A0AAD4UCN1_OVIAM|nr:hypothetical protein MG293_004288 [Ovis ammon polii]